MSIESRTKKPGAETGGTTKKMVRCAIYTRKSTEEGLNMEFNSLDAQREAAEAFIHSQRHEGWVVLPGQYDDGGFSGGNMDRPALQRLLAEVQGGKVDAIVVYKVDRLSRSLLDFSRIMETLDRHGCSFVSVTQQFNTTHSMGRLTLNILLSFAQFEREIISERTRDKMGAARRRGKWTGGGMILGYDLDRDARKLVVNSSEAQMVREIFVMYIERRSVLAVVQELNRRGVPRKTWTAKTGKNTGGGPWTKSNLTLLLTNVHYLGKVDYQGEIYDGEHEPIIELDIWSKTQVLLERNARKGCSCARSKFSGLLKGLLKCGSCGCSMFHTYTRKGTTQYRYYVCQNATKQGYDACKTRSIPAQEIEDFVVDRITSIGSDAGLVERIEQKARGQREKRMAVLEAEKIEIEKSLRHQAKLVAGIVGLPNAAKRLADLEDRVRAGEMRMSEISKEIAGLLGIGGWRLLDALGLKPEVCHLNEGHAAFAVLERARSFMHETGQPFDVALAATRAGNLFTTHTAVAAGFDRFSPALIEQYLTHYAEHRLGITLHDLMALGRQNPNDSSESFNMAYLAIRGSGAVNGVSRLHGKVSRNLFAPLFPHWPADEVPVGHITNGVHMPTWDSAAADDLWTGACGKGRWLGTTETLEQDIRRVSDADLWQFRNAASKSFVEFARERLSSQLAVSGASPEVIDEAKHFFDPNVLTLGFARRFATYKRPNLLLHDPERLLRLLTNPQRPVQLILAGKAHPADKAGQALIQEWMHFIRRPEVRPHVIFLSDYDMHLTAHLVEGVDVWINTPQRPWEACGTSGMKVLVNGGINLSELDGWWAEAYAPDLGWALGDGREHDADSTWDGAEAEMLYELLEHEVIPEFYARDQQGVPIAWTARMRESMARLTPQFSADRAVREYTEQHYLPAAAAYQSRTANKGETGRKIVDWRHSLEQKWATLHFGEVKVETCGEQHVFEVQVYLKDLDPDAVRVELYANGVMGGALIRQEMKLIPQLADVSGCYLYRAAVSAARPTADYTPRVIPHYDGIAIPLENARILWQR